MTGEIQNKLLQKNYLAAIVLSLFVIVFFGLLFIAKSSSKNPQQSNSIPNSIPTTVSSKFTNDSKLPNKLIITRSGGLSALSVTIVDEAKVRNLYKEIFALPTFTPGRYNCPADFNIKYLLDFYFNNVLVSHGIYYPTGCTAIQLDTLKVRQDPKGVFGQDLQQVLGLSRTDFIAH